MSRPKLVKNPLFYYEKTMHITFEAIDRLRVKNPRTKKTQELRRLLIILVQIVVALIMASHQVNQVWLNQPWVNKAKWIFGLIMEPAKVKTPTLQLLVLIPLYYIKKAKKVEVDLSWIKCYSCHKNKYYTNVLIKSQTTSGNLINLRSNDYSQ